jgi:hypothetical protein
MVNSDIGGEPAQDVRQARISFLHSALAPYSIGDANGQGVSTAGSANFCLPPVDSSRGPPTLPWSYGGFKSAEAHSAKAEGGGPVLMLDSRFRANDRTSLNPRRYCPPLCFCCADALGGGPMMLNFAFWSSFSEA